MREIPKNLKNLFAFFDFDLVQNGIKLLTEACSNGFTLLPLNTKAIGIAHEAKLPYILFDDFLGIDNIMQAKLEASKCELNWFEKGRNEFTFNNICWPVFDQHSMFWFWRDAAQAKSFTNIFLANDSSQLRFFLNDPLRPEIYYYESDTIGAIWAAILKDKAQPVKISHQIPDYLSSIVSSTIFKGYERYGSFMHPSQLKGKIVFALNQAEFNRFAPAIKDLSRTFPGEVAAVILDPDINAAKRLSKSYAIPVLAPLPASLEVTALQSQFLSGYAKSLNNSTGKSWEQYLKLLPHHFEYFCKHRWPSLVIALQSWLELWQEIHPRAIVVSELQDGESQLPAEAGTQCGIPTFSVPHGGVFIQPLKLPSSNYVLYNLPFQREIYETAGIHSQCLLGSRSLIAENEYPVVQHQQDSNEHAWRILAVTNPVSLPATLCYVNCFGPQINALRVLDKPPQDISENISIKIKPHPGWPDMDLFNIASHNLSQKVIPGESSLSDALEHTDLVIAVNYLGTALIHALNSNKPIILYWPDRLLSERLETDKNVAIFAEAGILIHTPDELWKTVREFFTDEALADQMRRKCLGFQRKYLDDSKFPTISEVVKTILDQHSTSESPAEKIVKGLFELPLDQFLPEHRQIAVTIVGDKFDYGDVPMEELPIICKLVRIMNPATIFEIGTYLGSTTLHLAANSNAEVFTIDLPPKGHQDYQSPPVIDKELDVYPETPGRKFINSAYATRIHQLFGDSQVYDFSSHYGKVDLVFVDAAHHYENVFNDSITAFKMIKPDGVIIWHDFASYAPGVVKALTEISGHAPLAHIVGTSIVVFSAHWTENNKHNDIVTSLETLKTENESE